MLESCWLSICEYLDEKSATLKIGPGVATRQELLQKFWGK